VRRPVTVTRISSRLTVWSKRLFPLFCVGVPAFIIAIGLLQRSPREDPAFFIGPCVVGVFLFLLLRKQLGSLADEVYDAGEYLLVKNRGEETRVPLTNVMNVSVSTFNNSRRITLRLVTPNKLGREVSFAPVAGFTLLPWGPNAVADDLIERVDRARSRR
jgi:hypothetical protein